MYPSACLKLLLIFLYVETLNIFSVILYSCEIKMRMECSICLDSLKSEVSTFPCGHIFHTDCIEKWLENGKNNCVQCRKIYDQTQVIKLYLPEGPEDEGYEY